MLSEFIEATKIVVGRTIPVLSTVLLLFIGTTPIAISGLADIFPSFVLIAIFYWALYRPEGLKTSFIFLLGFVQDVLLNLPFGISSMQFLCIHWIILTQRHLLIGKSFFVTWLLFAVISALPPLLTLAFMSVLVSELVNPMPVLVQYLLTVAFYPFITWILIQAHRLIQDPA